MAGQGVALAAWSIVYEDVRKGALRLIHGRPIPYKSGYRLMSNVNKQGMAKIEAFRCWLTQEVAEMAQALEQFEARFETTGP